MSAYDIPSLEEQYGWMYDEADDPPLVFDTDLDYAAEAEEADELAEHNRREADERPRENKWNPYTWSN